MLNSIVWFRYDLRLNDNPALSYAIRNSDQILLLLIIDPSIPELGTNAKWFYYKSIASFCTKLEKYSIKLNIFQGDPIEILDKIIASQQIESIYWNRVYEPEFITRDSKIKLYFTEKNIKIKSFNSSFILDPAKIKSGNDRLLKFEHYLKFFHKQKIKSRLESNLITSESSFQFISLPDSKKHTEIADIKNTLKNNGNLDKYWSVSEERALELMDIFINNAYPYYLATANPPQIDFSSKISAYLRFGLIDPQRIQSLLALNKSITLNRNFKSYSNSLAQREHCYYLIYDNPGLLTNPWNKSFESYPFENDERLYDNLVNAKSGFPYLDSAILELKTTGWINITSRLLISSFLIKLLNISWLKGVFFFNDHLIDADMAINAINWQSVCGSTPNYKPLLFGLNPLNFCKKIDPKGLYIKKWLPKLLYLQEEEIHQPPDPAKYGYEQPIIDVEQSKLNYLKIIEKISP